MYPVSGLLGVLAALPIALVPAGTPGGAVSKTERVGLTVNSQPAGAVPPSSAFDGFRDVARTTGGERAAQVRIEQRVIIRIAPAPGVRAPMPDPRRAMPEWRQNMIADMPGQGAVHLEERRMARCVPVSGIGGVRVHAGNRLLLFMRDRKIVSAALEKSCNPRDFYSGFYLERTTDGMLCSGRDTLHSRSGANCALGKLRQLVEVDQGD